MLDVMIGEVIGSYRIVAELGRGGMGLVYRAEHVQLGRPAAVKMLLPQLSSDAQIVQRFFNEARAASAIDHPGIVEVFDFGRHVDGSAYIVMPLLKGESLEQRLRRQPLAPVEAATIVAQVASALAAAHARGIVHRDLKPDNIFLVPNEMMPFGVQPKLLDFGIAKLAGDTSGAEFRTQTGIMMGTPAYMSPEQCMGKSDLDHRTDLYSLGCILYHLLGGRPPFTSEHGTGMIIAAHLRDIAPDVRTLNPTVPPALVAIVVRLLEKDPAARFQTALELRDALVNAGADAPRTKPPVATAAEQYGATMMAPSQPPVSAVAPTGHIGSTTRSGAAGQVAGSVIAAKPARSKAPIVVVATLLVGGGVAAAIVATQSGGSESAPEAAAIDPGSATTVETPAPPPKSPETPTTDTGAATASSTTPCTDGRVRNDDTAGHCCWPEQAYSNAKSRCVGVPNCPPGLVVRGESCDPASAPVVLAEAETVKPSATPGAPPHPRPIPQPKSGTVLAPKLTLDARSYAAGTPMQIAFAQPIASPNGKRAWITVVPAGSPPSAYNAWAFVDDGATKLTFEAPDKDGSYELRLHVNYPAQSTDLRQAIPFVVGAAAPVAGPSQPTGPTPASGQRFSAVARAKGGTSVTMRFPAPLIANPGEKFWVTVIEQGAPDSRYGAWTYVDPGARSAALELPSTAGDYELRLHANYPKQSTNVVFRAPIVVE